MAVMQKICLIPDMMVPTAGKRQYRRVAVAYFKDV
jgi:hypothetical protein